MTKPYGLTIDEIRWAKDLSGCFRTIEIEHSKIHDWKAFRCSTYRELPSSWYLYAELRTGSTPIHFKDIDLIDWTKDILVRMYEAPAFTTPWTTAFPCLNCDRNSDRTSEVRIYSDPDWFTVDDDWVLTTGTLMSTIFMPWTNQSATQPRQDRKEWILKPNTSYILQTRNLDSGATKLNADIFWYEVMDAVIAPTITTESTATNQTTQTVVWEDLWETYEYKLDDGERQTTTSTTATIELDGDDWDYVFSIRTKKDWFVSSANTITFTLDTEAPTSMSFVWLTPDAKNTQYLWLVLTVWKNLIWWSITSLNSSNGWAISWVVINWNWDVEFDWTTPNAGWTQLRLIGEDNAGNDFNITLNRSLPN